MAPESNADDGPEKPPFRGCVFCYTAEMGLFGARKVAARLSAGED